MGDSTGAVAGGGGRGRRRGLARLVVLVALGSAIVVPARGFAQGDEVSPAQCGADDQPETGIQGEITTEDMATGRSQQPYNCGLTLVGTTDIGDRGANWQLARIDHCAYVGSLKGTFATGWVLPGGQGGTNDPVQARDPHGVAIIDVSDPTAPTPVGILRTPGSLDVVETMHAVEAPGRSVLVGSAYGGSQPPDAPFPAWVSAALDVYDASGDCTQPAHMATVYWPRNVHNVTLNAEGTRVYGTAGFFSGTQSVMVMDITDMATPTLVGDFPLVYPDGSTPRCHHVSLNLEETRMYCAGALSASRGGDGPSIWDVTAVVRGDEGAEVRFVGEPDVGPGGWHHATPATIGGRPYLVAADELGSCPGVSPQIYDISDETAPLHVGEFELAMNRPENCTEERQNNTTLGNITSHYNAVDDVRHTTIGVFGFMSGGLRIANLRDPTNPVEVAYYKPGANPDAELQNGGIHSSNLYFNDKVTDSTGSINIYDWETGYIWFVGQTTGFHVVDLQPQVREQLDLWPCSRFPDEEGCHGPDGPAALDSDGAARPVVEREGGVDRVETAALVSRVGFDAAETVVLARADDYADALAGGPLAADRDAPMLLTDRAELSPPARAEIERLGATHVVLLGGEAAISAGVEAELSGMGVVSERVAGVNRFATAAQIARALSTTPTRVFVTEGEHADPSRGWPDALAVSPYAAFVGEPVLLVNAERLPDETAEALEELDPAEVVVVGGAGAVSDEVAEQLGAGGRRVRRIAAGTRYGTAALVRDEAVAAGMASSRVWLATGRSFPDALTAGPTVAVSGDSFALVDGHDLASSPEAGALLEQGAALERVTLVGGRAAISDEVERQIRDLVGASE